MDAIATEPFGRALRAARVAAGLTQEALAERAGVSVRNIQSLEAGHNRPQRDTARRLVAALGLDEAARAQLLAAATPTPRRHFAGPTTARQAYAGSPAQSTNLPLTLTSFVGRAREIAALTALLARTRLLTLTGAGGVGKTRLALHVAAEVVDRYPAGVWLVELAPLADPAQVVRTVAAVLGVQGDDRRPLAATLTAVLRPKQLLLVFDNCEHVLDACALLADALLRACPDLCLLATSREPLGVDGETTWPVPSLALPDARQRPSVETLGQSEAVQLFLERAGAAHPPFALTEHNAAAVAEICRRLDGIPLAIELAAARVRALAVEQIAARLDQRFRLLTGGSRAALPRQQTLRATVDWSYALLSPAEQILLARLSVFAGSFSLEATEGVCAGEPVAVEAVLNLLLRLVDKSLVLVDEHGTRYRLLETLRQYGREEMESQGEVDALQDRHATYYLAFARQAEVGLRGREQLRWMGRLEEDHDNIRAALAWCFAVPAGEATPAGRRERVARGVQLAGIMGYFWFYRGYRREGQSWLEQALARSDAAPLADRAALYGVAGLTAGNQGDAIQGLQRTATSLALYEQLGDRAELAWALGNVGAGRRLYRDYAEGTALLDRALALARELADPWLIGGVLAAVAHSADVRRVEERRHAREIAEEAIRLHRQLGDTLLAAAAHWPLGLIALYERDYAAARQALTTYRDSARATGDTGGVAVALTLLGDVARVEGDVPAAAPFYQESLALWRDLGVFSAWLAHALCGLGDVALAAGDLVQAHDYFVESLTTAHDAGALRQVARALEGLARLAAVQGHAHRAAILGGAAETLREQDGPAQPRDPDAHLSYLLPPARDTLRTERQEAAWAEGRAMSLEKVLTSTSKNRLSLEAASTDGKDERPAGRLSAGRRRHKR